MAEQNFNLLNLIFRLNRKNTPRSIDRDYVNLHKSERLEQTTGVTKESLKSNHDYKKDSNVTINIENFYGVIGNIEGKNSNINCSNPISFDLEKSDSTQTKEKLLTMMSIEAFKILCNRILKWILSHPIILSVLSGEIQWWKELLLIIFTNS